MEYLRLEDIPPGEVPSIAVPHNTSSEVLVPTHCSQAVPLESQTSDGGHPTPLQYPRVEDTSSVHASLLRSDAEKLMSYSSPVSPDVEKENDLDDPFGGILPLEKSVQRGCMDGKHYLPPLSNEDDDVRRTSRYAVQHRLQLPHSSEAHGSSAILDAIHGLDGHVGAVQMEEEYGDVVMGTSDGEGGDGADEVDYEEERGPCSHSKLQGVGCDVDRKEDEDMSQAEVCSGDPNLVRF
jgi:hypothetical protein